MTAITFQEINEHHVMEVQEIYNYYVTETTISFHTEPLSIEQMKASVLHPNARFKSFVIQNNAQLVGYVLLTQYKNKQAYDVSAEVTIYVKPNYLGRGIGKEALHYIEDVAKRSGFHTLIATICTENERSERLFTNNGYERCAYYKSIGYKFDRFLDIACYQKIL
jgi:L-amino acid N-acyltransferase YncA